MDLSKLDSKIAIEPRLATVKQNLTELDKLSAQRAALQLEFEKLRADESALLKQEDGDHDKKLEKLLKLRGSIDLKAGAIGVLDRKIAIAEESVHDAGEDTGRFLAAFHAATLVRLQETIQETTNAFIRPEDAQDLMNIATRHPNVRQIHWFQVPAFHKDWQRGYAEDIRQARLLDLSWADLQAAADAIGGELSVSIPEPWLAD